MIFGFTPIQNKAGRTNRAAWGFMLLMGLIWMFSGNVCFSASLSAADILAKIDQLIAGDISKWCQGKINYPAECALIRVFKRERQAEIWAKNDRMTHLELVVTIPICAVDDQPGPKLMQGDEKTPEGFYTADLGYGSQNWWMWMSLAENQLNQVGIVGQGACFKMCIDYPNTSDVKRTRNSGKSNPGSGICLHGNCVTRGCVSFLNRDFLPIFAFAAHHQPKKYGKLQIHIFPFRFDRINDAQMNDFTGYYLHRKIYSKKQLIDFWQGLKTGFDLFEKKPLPLTVSCSGLIRPGEYCSTVQAVKTYFKNHHHYPGPINDCYSADLVTFITTFQKKNHLPATGNIGHLTLSVLNILDPQLQAEIHYCFKN